MVKSRHGLASDCQGKLVERDRQAPGRRLLDRELVVASSQILHEAMPGDHDPGAAVLLSPRIGPSRAFSRPWSHSMWLLACRSVRWQTTGNSSSSTAGYTGAWSVTTSTGVILVVPMARSKKRRAALPSCWAETKISMTWPNR
jgi:hypothetical protein